MVSDYSLAPVKKYFTSYENKDQLSGKFEVYEADFKTFRGERMSSSSLPDEGGILNAELWEAVIPQLLAHKGDPYCESTRVGYQYGNVKKINVVFTEQVNELFFTQNLSSDQYDKVLTEILTICGAQ